MVSYIPKQGDIIEMDFNPTKGHEQKGKRLALIISNESYYRNTRLLIVCPISSTENNFPLHLKLDARTKTSGAVLSQHIRTIDPEARPISFIETAPFDFFGKVIKTINLFFIFDPNKA